VPAANYNGPVPVVTYVISDGNGGTDTGTLTLVVTPVNDPPIANDDSATTSENATLNGSVLANDTDVDGDTLVVTGFTIGSTHYAPGDTATISGVGEVTLRPDGTYTFVPEPGYNGPVPDVTYTVSDGSASDDGTLSIDIIPPNAVGANNDAATTPEDTSLSGNVLANDVDPNGAPLSVVNFTVAGDATVHAVGSTATIAGVGTLRIEADGGYTFVPAANYNGPVPVVTYTATDGPLSDTATLTITVTPVNDPPVAADDSGTTSEDTTLTGDVLANDTDVDGNPLSVSGFVVAGVNFASGQTAIIPTVGRLTINADGSYTFVPAADYNGAVPVATYTVSDGAGGTAAASLTIAITPVNDAPVAADDIATTAEDTTLTVAAPGLLSNDTDVDGNPLAVTSFSIAGVTGSFTAGSGAVIPGVGDLTINANGSYTFVPAADYNGTVPVVTYTVTDGTLSDTATLRITVTPVNDAPVATDDTATLAEDSSLTVAGSSGVLFNDTDIDGGPLSVTQFVVNNVIFAPGTPATIPGVGQLTINADGGYTFTPVANYNGAVPDATYTVSDGNGGTDTAVLRITVTPVNDAPVAADDSNSTAEDTTVVGGVLGNDTDIDGDTLSVAQFSVAGDPTVYTAGQTATIVGVGALTMNANGSYTFVPAADFSGPVPVVTYTASDSHGGTDTATLSLTVTPINDAPSPVADSGTTPEDTTLTVPAASGLLSNDRDADGDTLTIQGYSVAGVSGGFLAGATATIPGIGSLTINADGSYTFVPVANYNGPGPVATYRVTDGALTNTAVLTITVTPVNDPPVDGNETNAVTEDTTLTVAAASGLLANTTDIDGGPPVVIDFTVAGQTGPFTVGSGYLIAGVGTVTVNADGSYTFAPAANYDGAIPVITYTVSDGAGGTDTSTLTLAMMPVNDPPVDGDEVNAVTEDTALTVPAGTGLLANATDIDGGVLSISAFTVAGEAGPFAVGSGHLIAGIGTITVNADGSYSFAPIANYDGAIPVITYTVSDGAGGTDTSTLTLSMVPVNDPPVDGNETNSVTEDTTLNVPVGGGLLANTTDIDGGVPSVADFTVAGETGTFAVGSGHLIAGVGTITINADGSYSFAPAANYVGPIPVITYTVSDGAGGTDTSTLTLAIVPVNDPPVANDDTGTTPEETPLNGNVLTNDTDIDGDTLSIAQFTVAGDATVHAAGDTATIVGVGELTIRGDGTYTFVPALNYNGPVPIATYTASDGHGGTDTAALTLNVTPVNDPPVASDDTGTTPEDTTLNGNVLTNDTDIDGGPLRVTQFEVEGTSYTAGQTAMLPGFGELTVNALGSYTFVPAADYNGPVPIATYTVSDGRGGTDTATLTILVTPVNDPPVGTHIPNQTSVDATSVTPVDVSSHFSDVDGDVLTYSASGLPAGLSINPVTGVISGTLPNDASHHGPYTVDVSATDPSGLSTTETFRWTVRNPAPLALDDTASGPEDTMLTGTVRANDSDPDGDAIAVTRFVFGGKSYMAGQTATLAGIGSLIINADGTYTFAPALNYNGTVPSATYTLSDSDGGTDIATLAITITPVNDPPEIVDDHARGNEDTTITGNVLGNDTDPDADSLAVTGFSVDGSPTNYLPGETATIAGVGTISLRSDGSFTFIPAPNYDGPVPGIFYSASDGNGGTGKATLAIIIDPIDDFVPMPDDKGPVLPAGPDYSYNPEDVDGAVVEAVHGLDGLNEVADLSERPIDAVINTHQDLNSPIRFAFETFRGGSSAIVIDQATGPHERIEIESIKHAGILYLQIIDETDGGAKTSILGYRLRALDRSAAPSWLRQVGAMTFAGHPDADAGLVRLILTIVYRDGRVSDHELQLDSVSGHVSQPRASRDDGQEGRLAPMFSQQINEGSMSRNLALLERALGFR
jgi:VCBS repeat-containing protein